MTRTLRQYDRLKSRKLIGAVFAGGKKLHTPFLRVNYLLKNDEKGKDKLQLGVTVSTKSFPRAVHRNRIKRLLREAWRLNKTPLQEKLGEKRQLLVFLIYTQKELPSFSCIVEQVQQIIGNLEAELNKKL